MLTLVRGQSKKSTYLSIMHKATPNSIVIQYGKQANCWLIESHLISLNKSNDDLRKVIDQLLTDLFLMGYNTIFLYADFTPDEAEILKEVVATYPPMNVIASVQDYSIPRGQLLIEEVIEEVPSCYKKYWEDTI